MGKVKKSSCMKIAFSKGQKTGPYIVKVKSPSNDTQKNKCRLCAYMYIIDLLSVLTWIYDRWGGGIKPPSKKVWEFLLGCWTVQWPAQMEMDPISEPIERKLYIHMFVDMYVCFVRLQLKTNGLRQTFWVCSKLEPFGSFPNGLRQTYIVVLSAAFINH